MGVTEFSNSAGFHYDAPQGNFKAGCDTMTKGGTTNGLLTFCQRIMGHGIW